MNLSRKLLAVVAMAGMIGSALAVEELGTLSPALLLQTHTYADTTTFADVYNFTVGTQYQTVLGSAFGTSVSDLTLAVYSDGALVSQVSSPNGSLIDQSGFLLAGNYSAHVSGVAQAGGGYQFSVAATPEPAEWMLLLCGLMVAGFIARRKMDLVAAA